MTAAHSFSKRLSKNIVGIINILFVASALVTFFFALRFLRASSSERTSLILANVTSVINGQIGKMEAIIREESWYFDHDHPDSAYMRDVMANILTEYQFPIGGAVAYCPKYIEGKSNPSIYVGQRQDGSVYDMPLTKDGYDYVSQEWYKIPAETGCVYWSNPYSDYGLSNRRISTMSYPLKNRAGDVYAVLTLDIAIEWVTYQLEAIKPYEHGYVTLVNKDGIFISNPYVDVTHSVSVSQLLGSGQFYCEEGEALQQAMVSGSSGMADLKTGKHRLTVTYGPLSNGWSLAVVCPMVDIYRDMNNLSIGMMIIVFMVLIMLYCIINHIIKRESQPIVEFTYSAKNMAKGNFHAVIPEVKTKDEIKDLQESLCYMQHSINDYMSELKTSTAENERYENELNIARNLQLSMVPTNFPVRNDVGVYARLQPAREVGGDLYDFTALDNRFYFAIGDVSGKGVPAALVMAICRSSVRFVSGLGLKLSEVVNRVNNVLCDGNETGMFVTMAVGRMNLVTGKLELCNAGHNPMVVVPPTGEPYYYKAKANLATGLFENFPYQGEELQIEKGTRLILYTDGVTEAEDISKDQYGEDRLLDFARNIVPGTSDRQVVDDLYASVKAFTKDNEQNDDITVLSFTYNG